jgi:hypothetical protein
MAVVAGSPGARGDQWRAQHPGGLSQRMEPPAGRSTLRALLFTLMHISCTLICVHGHLHYRPTRNLRFRTGQPDGRPTNRRREQLRGQDSATGACAAKSLDQDGVPHTTCNQFDDGNRLVRKH